MFLIMESSASFIIQIPCTPVKTHPNLWKTIKYMPYRSLRFTSVQLPTQSLPVCIKIAEILGTLDIGIQFIAIWNSFELVVQIFQNWEILGKSCHFIMAAPLAMWGWNVVYTPFPLTCLVGLLLRERLWWLSNLTFGVEARTFKFLQQNIFHALFSILAIPKFQPGAILWLGVVIKMYN